MDKEHFSKLLIEQLDRGRKLLSLISNIHESQNDFGDGTAMLGGEDLYYVPEDELEDFNNKYAQWKSYVQELLEKQFGIDDQYVYDWKTYVVTHVSKRKPILNQLRKNVNKGLSLLSSFLERLEIHFRDNELIVEKTEEEKIAKIPLVFISHSSKDTPFIEPFKNIILKQGLGLQDCNIVCTSFESTGVPPGENIPQYIKDNISQADVFLAMVSTNYKASEVCMNEVGAAWALDKKPIQVVLPGVEFTQLGWLIHLDKAAKIDNCDSLDHLAEVICDGLGKPMVTPRHWNGPKKDFLDAIATAADAVALAEQPCSLCFQDGSQEMIIRPKFVATYYSSPMPKVQKQDNPEYAANGLMSMASAINAIAAQYIPEQKAQVTIAKPASGREYNRAICQVQLWFNNSGDVLENIKVELLAKNGVKFSEDNYRELGIGAAIRVVPRGTNYLIDDSSYWCNVGEVNAESSRNMPLLYVEMPFLYRQYDKISDYSECYPQQIVLPYSISTKHKRYNGSLTIKIEPEFEEEWRESKTLAGKIEIRPKLETIE